ncbi:MAG TPA: tetratricopeptide repeat protein [Candidatus Udaeobacter sp.]|nr:tetratricopeptide repeat protein [Candidatus Udaeobacter sp.]
MHEIARRIFSSRGRVLIFAVVLTAVTILAYRPAWHGGFLWDDDDYIIKNELLTAPDGWQRIWFSLDSPSQYFPFTYSTFRLDHALWGLNTTGYHWVNLLLHVGNALLLWAVLARLKVPGSWFAAAIFALHPVQVESVAWITERKNVLMGFFFLLTLLAWIVFVDERTRRPWLFYCLALICYVLALSAKATACTLPAALFLILWLQKKPITMRRLIQILPFVALGIGMGLLVVWWERYHQGTNRGLFTFLSPTERILVASRAVWFYLSKIFWPSNLTFIYPRWNISPANLIDYIWLVAGLAACGAIYFSRRFFGRSVEIAAAFFVATLCPVLGFVMLFTFRYTFVADHYQYLACIGPIALASAGIANLSDKSPQYRGVIVSIALLIVAGLGTLTWRQAATYANIETLWRTTLARNPECWMAHTNLGLVFLQQGKIDDGIAQYRSALQMQPDSWDAEYNLGTALLGKGQVDEAILHCEKAVHMRPTDPDALVSLGNALFQKGRIDEAITHYQEAIRARPDHFLARYSLGRALLEKGELDGAIQVCQSALLLAPSDADCHTTLAIALEETGNPAEAVSHYQKALELAPGSISTLTNLAWLLATSRDASLRNGPKAVELAKQADRLVGGTNTVVLRTLAAAYAEKGEFANAIKTARSAMELARMHGEASLTADLDQQMALYQLGMPYREKAK